MESGLIIRAKFPPRHTPPWRIALDRCQNSCWSVIKGASLGEKDISLVAVLNTFLAIAELFKDVAEFLSPADGQGRALLKLPVLGTIISFVEYFITFPGD